MSFQAMETVSASRGRSSARVRFFLTEKSVVNAHHGIFLWGNTPCRNPEHKPSDDAYLWNGNHREALACMDGLANDLDDLEELPTTFPGIKAFQRSVDELRTYVRRHAHTIANYAERHRYGERVSTAFAESTVNAVVAKRFVKRQQMRWSKRGAHLMLQTRTRVLDETLRAKFLSWYPGLFHVRNADRTEHALDA